MQFYDKTADYQALIRIAVDKCDFNSAAILEVLRNEKIKQEHLPYPKTYEYIKYLLPRKPKRWYNIKKV